MSQVTDKAVWRSLDELADTPEFRDFARKEFPGFANVFEALGEAEPVEGGHTSLDRRRFMALSAAGLALAGLAGCRRPDLQILPYSQKPDDVVPGKPSFYATSIPRPSGAFPVLAESHEGRPTKIEGNPQHPLSKGSTDLFAQASVLDMYSPDRVRTPSTYADGARTTQTWAEFDSFADKHFRELKVKGGEGLAFLMEMGTSPAQKLVQTELQKSFPKAIWSVYEPLTWSNVHNGTKLAFGSPMGFRCEFDKARRVVSLDSDFLGGNDELSVLHSRKWAEQRRNRVEHYNEDAAEGHDPKEHGHNPVDEMMRLYCVESGFSITGTMADHRLRLASSQVAEYAILLAKEIAAKTGAKADGAVRSALDGVKTSLTVPAQWIAEVAADLVKAGDKSIVLAGPRQPAVVHAVCAFINVALGSAGKNIVYTPASVDPTAKSIGELVGAMNAGKVGTLVVVGGNPVNNAPADLDFAGAMKKVGTTIRAGLFADETGDNASWRLPLSHYLETWDTALAFDGSLCSVQPLIAPLFGSRSTLELLIHFSGFEKVNGYDAVKNKAYNLVQRTFAAAFGKDDAPAFRKFLHEGFLPAKPAEVKPLTLAGGAVAEAVRGYKAIAVSKEAPEVVFAADYTLHDGRFATNGWMLECPDPVTKLVWDNAALISPKFAKELGVRLTGFPADVLEIEVGGKKIEIPAYVLPGQADYSITLPLGYGRIRLAHISSDDYNGGVDVYPLRTSASPDFATAKVTKTSKTYRLVTTQDTGTIAEDRDEIVSEISLVTASFGNTAHDKKGHGHGHGDAKGHGAENKHDDSRVEAPVGNGDHHHHEESPKERFQAGYDGGEDAKGRIRLDLSYPETFTGHHQWGMVIDMDSCTGCSACVVACQSENNVPIVGKNEVRLNREMHWIRIDRYFTTKLIVGGTEGKPTYGETVSMDDPRIVSQPMACQQCEAAPCESVCPVNATVHSPEGLNLQVYNRCIGTRYCSNNCPYKVRRFNWFNFNERGLDTLRVPTFLGQVNADGGRNEDSLSPKGMPETLKMQKNPDVTVRMRGVMEKCTYCMQRIERAKIGAKVIASNNNYVRPENLPQAAPQEAGKKAYSLTLSQLKGDEHTKSMPAADMEARAKLAATLAAGKLVGYYMGANGKEIFVPDGTIKVACEQACPTQAITFGNLTDSSSRVHKLKQRESDFLVLGSRNIKPRTSYMPRLRNLNPKMVQKEAAK